VASIIRRVAFGSYSKFETRRSKLRKRMSRDQVSRYLAEDGVAWAAEHIAELQLVHSEPQES
jgi:hypothetical protein